MEPLSVNDANDTDIIKINNDYCIKFKTKGTFGYVAFFKNASNNNDLYLIKVQKEENIGYLHHEVFMLEYLKTLNTENKYPIMGLIQGFKSKIQKCQDKIGILFNPDILSAK